MTREEYIEFANALKNNYTIDFDKLPEFCDMAISTLSTDGEYIKKEEALLAVTEALKKGFACFDEYETWWLYKGTKLSLTKAIDSISVVHIPEPHKGESEVFE